MIIFKKVRWKNLLSTGNYWTEISLDTHTSSLIVGENGAGKSTMLDAICFGLYGKPFRKITKPQLVNSINQKGSEVEVEFQIGKSEYKIRRCIKPNVFEIWKDGEMINQDASARDYQEYLEESILKMNIKSFGQVVVLGSSTFVPFMQLTAAARREVIEDLLDIQIFTTMKILLKDRVTDNNQSVVDVGHQIQIIQNQIDSAKAHNKSIRELKKKEVKKLKLKALGALDSMNQEQKTIDDLYAQSKKLEDTISDKATVALNHNQLLSIGQKISERKARLAQEVDFYKNHDNCPTCRQSIDETFRDDLLKTHEAKIAEVEEAYVEYRRRMDECNNRTDEIKNVEGNLLALGNEIREHEVQVRMLKSTLKDIKTEILGAEKDVEQVDESNIRALESDLANQRGIEADVLIEKEVLTVVSAMLKDGGIKTKVVRQYVPIMNKLINKYLAQMDFFVQFELDDNFNEVIKSRYCDVFSYSSFSEGEKLRIDLALLFTWRAVSKLRNSVSTNLLIMDEIMDSSLDDAGTDEFLRIINDLTADTNVFIISHKGDQLHEKFERVLKFRKIKNYSYLEENA